MTKYDWPGWALADNQFGEEFDLDARKRMIKGSSRLLMFLEKYKKQMGNTVLEAGPFFRPLVKPESGRNVIYVDNDQQVLDCLRKKYPLSTCISLDLHQSSDLRRYVKDQSIDSIVASQLFNYVPLDQFLDTTERILRSQGLLFVNHSTNYGLTSFFTPDRPSSNQEVLEAISRKFNIVEVSEKPSEFATQPHPRIIIVAKA